MTTNIIKYITQNTNLKQKDIAKRLDVTKGQISKWKKGEYISPERKADLIELAVFLVVTLSGLILSQPSQTLRHGFYILKNFHQLEIYRLKFLAMTSKSLYLLYLFFFLNLA